MDDDHSDLKESLTQQQSLGNVGEEDAKEIARVLDGEDDIELPAKFKADSDSDNEATTPDRPPQKEEEDIRAMLNDMKLPQKIKYAMFGNQTCRTLLIFDANRMVQEAVLKNPQLRVAEIEDFTKNPNIAEFVLRWVSNEKSYMKNYALKKNLVLNPKSPQDVSLKWLRYLRVSDLRNIAKSKNLPQVVAITARKRVAEMQKKGK